MKKANSFLVIVLLQIFVGTMPALGYVCPQGTTESTDDPLIVSAKQDAVNEWPRFLGSQINGIAQRSCRYCGSPTLRKDTR